MFGTNWCAPIYPKEYCQAGPCGEVEFFHPRLLVHYVRVLRQGGAILHDVPRRAVPGGDEGERGQDGAEAAVYGVQPRNQHAILLELRTPVQGGGDGRAHGDSGRERTRIVGA